MPNNLRVKNKNRKKAFVYLCTYKRLARTNYYSQAGTLTDARMNSNLSNICTNKRLEPRISRLPDKLSVSLSIIFAFVS